MFRKNILINTILISLTIFLGIKAYKIWTLPLSPLSHQAQQKNAGDKEPETAPAKEEQMSAEEIFQPIVQNDVFRSSRTEPRPEEISKPVSVPVIPPKLFGTIILGDLKTAILEDPATKLSKTYRINESVGGFVLFDIQKDKVVLSRDGEITEVYLREIKAFKPQPSPVPQPPQPPQRGRRDLQGMPSPQPRPAPQPPSQQPPQPPDVPPFPEEEIQQ